MLATVALIVHPKRNWRVTIAIIQLVIQVEKDGGFALFTSADRLSHLEVCLSIAWEEVWLLAGREQTWALCWVTPCLDCVVIVGTGGRQHSLCIWVLFQLLTACYRADLLYNILSISQFVIGAWLEIIAHFLSIKTVTRFLMSANLPI